MARVVIPHEELERLWTPCLVVDRAAVERNVARAERIASTAGLRLRPHFKAHKCTRLMDLQLRSGIAVGATCQTAREARVLADSGVRDILVANELVTRDDLRTAVDVAMKARLTVAVDNVEHVRLLREVVPSQVRRLDVVIELDVGLGRCGVEPGPGLIEIADAVTATQGLEFEGLLAYEGHLSLKEDRGVRAMGVRDVRSRIEEAVSHLRGAGHDVPLVTGGGTGTLLEVAELASHSEVQPGSYVLMDATYGRLGLDFEAALFCVATVISRPTPSRAVLDAGLKAMSVEYGMPKAIRDEVFVTRLADEHAVAAVGDGVELRIGARELLQPSHVDPTVNLHDRLYVWDGSTWDEWPVDGRR